MAKLRALATFSGTTIGVGLFGLPFVTAQVGFLPMLGYFAVISIIMLYAHLLYGEIVSRTPTNQRLPGYARIYLGKKAERLEYVSTIIGLTGALLAYIVIGSQFLHALFAPFIGGSILVYASIFFILGALLIYTGSQSISRAELLSLVIFFSILILLLIKALPLLESSHFITNNLTLNNLFLPYGVILFSLAGVSVIPEMKEVLGNQEKAFKKLIIIGTFIPVIAYLVFIVTVFGVTGAQTTQEALVGFSNIVGGGVTQLGFVFGIITTFTSFLTLGITLKKEYHLDWGLPKKLSWVLAVAPAMILYVLGFQNFITIISFVGAVALGIDIVTTTLIYLKARKVGKRVPVYKLAIPTWGVVVIAAFFCIGACVELLSLIR